MPVMAHRPELTTEQRRGGAYAAAEATRRKKRAVEQRVVESRAQAVLNRRNNWSPPLVGCQNSVRLSRNQRFPGGTLIWHPTPQGWRPHPRRARPATATPKGLMKMIPARFEIRPVILQLLEKSSTVRHEVDMGAVVAVCWQCDRRTRLGAGSRTRRLRAGFANGG